MDIPDEKGGAHRVNETPAPCGIRTPGTRDARQRAGAQASEGDVGYIRRRHRGAGRRGARIAAVVHAGG